MSKKLKTPWSYLRDLLDYHCNRSGSPESSVDVILDDDAIEITPSRANGCSAIYCMEEVIDCCRAFGVSPYIRAVVLDGVSVPQIRIF